MAVKKLNFSMFRLNNFIKRQPEAAPIVTDEYIDEHYIQAVRELERKKLEREKRLQVLIKRRTYYTYFKIRQRYGISFKEFNRRVDAGTWYAYMAD